MIAGIIDLLNKYEYYGVSKRIDIAKGYYSIPKHPKMGIKQIKRIIRSKRNG